MNDTWLMVALPLLYSPGPGNILSAGNAGRGTIKETLSFIAGLQFPVLAYSLLIGYGLLGYITERPVLVQAISGMGDELPASLKVWGTTLSILVLGMSANLTCMHTDINFTSKHQP